MVIQRPNDTICGDLRPDRLADLGIYYVFGVPGDYSFSINDAVEVIPG